MAKIYASLVAINAQEGRHVNCRELSMISAISWQNRGHSIDSPGDPLPMPYFRLRMHQFWPILTLFPDWVGNGPNLRTISLD